jgi:hypothetical protein
MEYFFMADLLELKEAMFNNLRLRLGGNIVDLELDPENYEAAYQFAIKTYRQRGQNAYEESYMLLEIQANQNSYILPQEVTKVRECYRRTVGLETGPSATSFDPFSSAILNTYLLNYNYAGGLATYDFYAGYVELAARMFGGYVIFTFNSVTKEIQFVRDFKGTGEKILLWTDNMKPEIVLLQDPNIGNWISSWVLAQLKVTIGEAREKYGTIAGPQGGTTLNGTAMKAEGAALMLELIDELKRYVDGSQPLTWIQG